MRGLEISDVACETNPGRLTYLWAKTRDNRENGLWEINISFEFQSLAEMLCSRVNNDLNFLS